MNVSARAAIALTATVVFALTGCASATSDPKAELIESISSQLEQSGLDDGQVSCMQDQLSSWEVSWLEYLNENFDSDLSGGPAEVNLRIAGALASCLG